MSGLKQFKFIPLNLMEWSRWMRDQDVLNTEEVYAAIDVKVEAQAERKYWDDLRFPASLANPAGSASPPGYDTTNGGLLFAAAGTELVFFQAQLPHFWAIGTTLFPHCHWQKTTSAAGNVYWQLEYKWCPIGEVMDATFTTLASSTVVGGTPDDDTANQHLITALGEINGSGKTISDMLLLKFSRIGGNAADTYGSDARLLEFDIHIQNDGRGSLLEFQKI